MFAAMMVAVPASVALLIVMATAAALTLRSLNSRHALISVGADRRPSTVPVPAWGHPPEFPRSTTTRHGWRPPMAVQPGPLVDPVASGRNARSDTDPRAGTDGGHLGRVQPCRDLHPRPDFRRPLGGRGRPGSWVIDRAPPSLLPPVARARPCHRRRMPRRSVRRRLVGLDARLMQDPDGRADRPTGTGRRSLRWACSASEHSPHGYRHTPRGRPASIDRS